MTHRVALTEPLVKVRQQIVDIAIEKIEAMLDGGVEGTAQVVRVLEST